MTPYRVRIKQAGGPAFTWNGIEADHPYRAAAEAFREDHWPEVWEHLPASDGPELRHFYVTVTEEHS